jgi:hypothetical protein
MAELTEPKLVAGRWSAWQSGQRCRSLTYGSTRHKAQIEGVECHDQRSYQARLGHDVSPEFRYSYQAHVWFLERARTLFAEAG